MSRLPSPIPRTKGWPCWASHTGCARRRSRSVKRWLILGGGFVEAVPVHEFIGLDETGGAGHAAKVHAAVEAVLDNAQRVRLELGCGGGEQVEERHRLR